MSEATQDEKAQPSAGTDDAAKSGAKNETRVTTAVPERTEGQLNPSSPANTGTTPGTNAKVG